jgi:hypothetical protein
MYSLVKSAISHNERYYSLHWDLISGTQYLAYLELGFWDLISGTQYLAYGMWDSICETWVWRHDIWNLIARQWLLDSLFSIWDLGLDIWNSGFRTQYLELDIWPTWNLIFGIWDVGLNVWNSGAGT